MKLQILIYFVLVILMVYTLKSKKISASKESIEKVKILMNEEALLKSIRKIRVENQTDSDAEILFIFKDSESNNTYENINYMPAKESGWLPYFVPGILELEYKNSKAIIDITEPNKEYNAIIDPNGFMTTYKCDITE